MFAFDPNAETVAEAQRSLTEEKRERVRFAMQGAEALEVPRERFEVTLVGPSPLVSGSAGPHGELDMSAWVETIASVAQGFEIALTGGLFRIEHGEFVTHDALETAEELLETASDWRDTEIPAGLAERVRVGSPPFTVPQNVRVRRLYAPRGGTQGLHILR